MTRISHSQHILENFSSYAPPELSDPATTRIRLAFAIFVICLIINVEKMPSWLNVKIAAAVIGVFSPSRFRTALLFSLLQHNVLKIIIDGYLYANKFLSPNLTLQTQKHQDLLHCQFVLVEFYGGCSRLTSDELVLKATLYLGG